MTYAVLGARRHQKCQDISASFYKHFFKDEAGLIEGCLSPEEREILLWQANEPDEGFPEFFLHGEEKDPSVMLALLRKIAARLRQAPDNFPNYFWFADENGQHRSRAVHLWLPDRHVSAWVEHHADYRVHVVERNLDEKGGVIHDPIRYEYYLEATQRLTIGGCPFVLQRLTTWDRFADELQALMSLCRELAEENDEICLIEEVS